MDRPIEDVQWRDFELYERVRVRENRKRFFVLGATVLVFFSLCAVPVFKERLPKWGSLRGARHIAVALERLKTLAIHEKRPIKMKLLASGRFQFVVTDRCADGVVLREMAPEPWTENSEEWAVLSREQAGRLALALASDEVCFDPVFGLELPKGPKVVVVVVPVKDLTAGRLDRASYVILEGESAKISIN
jgi:hypothetical protein